MRRFLWTAFAVGDADWNMLARRRMVKAVSRRLPGDDAAHDISRYILSVGNHANHALTLSVCPESS